LVGSLRLARTPSCEIWGPGLGFGNCADVGRTMELELAKTANRVLCMRYARILGPNSKGVTRSRVTPCFRGAEAGTRTPTGLRPLDPEPKNTAFQGTPRNIESFVFSSGYAILWL
jgi:hypothetical protein